MGEDQTFHSLHDKLSSKLKEVGSLSVYQFMKACLYDEAFGVYRVTNPIGADAHFTTAPEISQMFGEIIAIWIYNCLEQFALDSPVNLVELGPGRGTLMQDIVRSLSRLPTNNRQLTITMVERAAPLIELQKKKLANSPWPITWITDVTQCTNGSTILIANEFFDCFPMRQFIYQNLDWFERLVALDDQNELYYTLGQHPLTALERKTLAYPLPKTAPNGSLYEIMPDLKDFTKQLIDVSGTNPCYGLFIDYGNLDPTFGDTVQALYQHQKTSPFAHLGDRNQPAADLTAHVNFTQLAHHLTKAGFVCHPLLTQQDFLLSHGLELRANALMSQATKQQKETIQQGLFRLIDKRQMGSLFKCLSFTKSK